MYNSIAVQCAALFLVCHTLISVRGMEEKTSMYVKRSQTNDQSMSGSGYSYDGDGGKPQEYSFELGDDNGRAFEILKELGYDPFAESQRYAEENAPLPYEQYTKEYSTNPVEKPLVFYVNQNAYNIPQRPISSIYPQTNEYRKSGIDPVHAYPYAAGYAHNDFLKKYGKSYNDEASSKHGERLDTGYKTLDAFNKGLHGSYDNQHAKSYYDQNGGNKQLAYDHAGNYAANQAAGKASKGGSFGQKDFHKKGSKTTGYHKVLHKDDYNKQHKFYDKADKSGHFKKHGDYDANFDNAQGHYAKGGHKDSGYESDQYGEKGISDKGKFEEVAKGFRKANGNEGFFQDYAGFSKKGGKETGSVGGYSV